MTLQSRMALGNRGLDLAIDVADGETVALLGPNGAGKSTAMSVLAGLVRPDDGEAALDGRTLFAVRDRQARVWVPPHDRGVALLAQEPLLFPHLSAVDNVAFGPRSRRRSRRSARQAAGRWLAEVGAQDLAHRRPGELSGGQAQRVAVARALAAEPRLLLLDEPMAALDVTVALSMRHVLRRVLHGRSAVVITHDVIDAVLLADRVLVVEGGRVVERGPTQRVLTRPRSPFAARIAGLNMVRGKARGDAVTASDGLHIEGLPQEPLSEGAPAVAVFSPSAVAVYREPPGGSPRNAIRATVTDLEPHAHQVRIHAAGLSADVTPAALTELRVGPGDEVVLAVKASEVRVYPA